MPAARYWRAVGLQSVGGGALELSALHLYLGGVRVDAAATLTSTFAPASGTLAALQEEDTSTTARWLDVSAPGFALVWDFGAGNAQDVATVRLGSGALYTEWLETLTLQHSSDGVAWTTHGSIPAFSWPGANALQGVPAGGDPHFDKVSLLLHMDGVDGSATFIDSSAAPKTAIVTGDVQISTAHSKWGGASCFFGVGGGEVKYANDTAFGFGTGDFTLEAWVRRQNSECALFDVRAAANEADALVTYISANGYLSWYDSSPKISTVQHIPVGEWMHVAYSRSSGVLHMFVGGVLVRSDAKSSDFGAARPLRIGRDVVGGAGFSGYIDDLRITKGVARYTASFTPPDAPFGNSVVGAVAVPPLQRAPAPERARIAASSTVPPHSTLSAPRLLTARNLEFAGTGTASATGTIYGSTAIKGSPNSPVRAKVSLLRARDLLLVQQTWSDPTTGAYAFHGLDPAEKYTTLAEYPTGDRRAVAADQLTPDIEEARAP